MPKHYHNIKDTYKEYKKLSNNPIEVSTYIMIVNGFMKFLFKKLLKRGEVLLPERLGYLQVIGKKTKIKYEEGKIKGLVPDWKETKLLWEKDEEAKINKQLVYHFNENTNGVRYKVLWSKNRVLVPNKIMYNLVLTRSNKRALAKEIKQGREYLIRE